MRFALALLLIAGCGGTIDSIHQPLEVSPIDGLPSYDGGRILHPWHFSKPDRDRFPLPSIGTAADPLCLLGDSYFRDCLIYECAADLSCPGRSRCVDAAFVFDPEGSRLGTDYTGIQFYEAPSGDRYYTLHDAVCVKG